MRVKIANKQQKTNEDERVLMIHGQRKDNEYTSHEGSSYDPE